MRRRKPELMKRMRIEGRFASQVQVTKTTPNSATIPTRQLRNFDVDHDDDDEKHSLPKQIRKLSNELPQLLDNDSVYDELPVVTQEEEIARPAEVDSLMQPRKSLIII